MFANKTIQEESGGPNDMFTELQKVDIGLKRRRIGGDGGRTNHFTKNFGMPYSFITAVDSESFNTAPQAVRDAHSRMNWAARMVFGEDKHEPFNECMVLGYFEKNKIEYHDDGETGLGPTIATLSLGYSASMSVRMKRKHFQGCTKGSNFVNREPMPGSNKYDERLAAWKELEKLNTKERKTRIKTMAKELGLKASGDAPVILKMTINHGDIVIMHGCLLQEVYEHQVEPTGKLRFALTCRNIELDSLKPENRPDYEVKDEEVHYDGLALPPPKTRE